MSASNTTSSKDPVPCIRYDEAGINNPRLRDILADANRRAGHDLSSELASLVDHSDQLLASWRTPEGRQRWSPALTQAWRARMGDRPFLHLIPSDEEPDLMDDAIDSPTAGEL